MQRVGVVPPSRPAGRGEPRDAGSPSGRFVDGLPAEDELEEEEVDEAESERLIGALEDEDGRESPEAGGAKRLPCPVE